MKLSNALIVIMAFSIIIGCSNQPINQQQPNREKGFSYNIDEQEDVINRHGIIVKNRKKLDDFINNQSGIQRVVHYTIEGDPIFNDLSFKDNKIEMRYDTTKDKFGAPEVKTYTCAKLERNETDKFLKYTLMGCEGDRKEIEILQIPFDVGKQDTFEFVLKYGENGEMSEVSDFHLTTEERQTIYKAMVLANYLGEKQLSNPCNREPYVSYDLTVNINSGSRHYQWTECDSSEDGIKMTELAKAIIDIVQAR